jgi:hypothetical protein
MIFRAHYKMKLQEIKQHIIPFDQRAKKFFASELAPVVSQMLDMQCHDRDDEKVCTAEIVILSKTQMDHIEIMASALSWQLNRHQRIALQKIIHEIKFK